MNPKRSINLNSFFFNVVFLAVFSSLAFAQNIVLSPPMGLSGSSTAPRIKIFFNPAESVILTWTKNLPASPADGTEGYKFKIGSSTGNYNRGNIPVSGLTASFSPASAGLSSGRYYGVITNSSKDNLSGIQNDFLASSAATDYSNQIEFIVEAPNAPAPTEPKGTINTPTPYFKWNSIPGVKAYWLIVSSTKFSVVTQSDGKIVVQGANIVWNYLTSQTSVLYGSNSSNSPLSSSAPPLTSDNTYYYTLLNVYDDEDITYASSVFGGVESFTYESQTVSVPPQLAAPANNSVFYGTNSIKFQWGSVPNANSYGVFLFQRVSSFAGNDQQIDIPVWSTSTTNTSVDFPAKSTLTKGKYIWYVVPKDNTGSGSKSESYEFDYIVPLGKFRAQVYSAADASGIIGFELYPTAISGGSTPSNPLLATNSLSYTDSLVVGTYQFRAKKSGYYDSTKVVDLTANGIANFTIYLRPYPSRVSGRVIDQAGAPVNSALITLQNLLNGSTRNINSTVDGSFSSSIPKGTYSLQVSKAGYVAAKSINVTADMDQLIISQPFVLKLDNASVSGKVINNESQPVQLTSVSATQGSVVQKTTTDNSGTYSLNLSSGHWTIEVSKEGFVAPAPAVYDLATGDNLQNQNITIIPRANQVTGYVYKVSTEGGKVGTSPFGQVTLKAAPGSGNVVTAVSNSNGQYSLSLKSGTWTISASAPGYSSSDPVQLNLTVAQTFSNINFTLKPNPSVISGTALLSDGSSLADVTIVSSAGASTITLANGTYQMSLPAQSQTISAEKSGYVPSAPVTLSLQPGQNLTGIDFRFVPNAGKISGIVLNQNEPVTGAVIKASSGTSSSEQTSSRTGEFSFNLLPGTWTITASKSGFLTSLPKTVTIGSGQQSNNNDFNLVANIAKIEGSITGNSQPLSNAQVLFTDLNNAAVSVKTQTDPSGYFSISLDGEKAYSIKVTKEGYNPSAAQTQTLKAGQSVNISFNLNASPSSIAGNVMDNLQSPLADVKLYFISGKSVIDSAMSSYNGSYYSGLPSGTIKIISRKGGYLTDSTTVSLSPGQNITGINFNLKENFAMISGQVKDPSGNTIDAVKIDLLGTKGGMTSVSNSDGSYIIQGITGAVYNLTFSKAGYGDYVLRDYRVSDGQTIVLKATMSPVIGKISGRVSTAEGHPIENAAVFAKDQLSELFSTVTGKDGSFEIPSLAMGEYTVSAAMAGYSSSQNVKVILKDASISAAANISDMTLNSGKITGEALDQSGQPVMNTAISITGPSGSAGTVTNSTGLYSLESLVPGTYTISAEKKGYTFKDTAIVVSASSAFDVKLKKNQTSITGTILNQQGQVLPFAVPVNLVSSMGNLYSVTTDISGKYIFEGVEDNASLHISTELFKKGFANDSATVFAAPGATSVQKNLTIKESSSAISGSVGAVADVAINITDNASAKIIYVNSSADGKYFMENLAAGSYTVKPEKSGYVFVPASSNLTLGFRDTASVQFTAGSNTGSLKVTAKDQASRALEQVTVNLVSSDTLIVKSGVTNSSGEAWFREIPAGKSYTISVSREGYFSSAASVNKTLSINENAAVDFTLVMANSIIAGHAVISGSSSPVSEAGVKLLYQSGQSVMINSGADGSFTFTSLPPGKNIMLTAIKPGYVSDTLLIADLAQGETKNALELKLKQTTVRISGSVMFNGSGLQNISLSAVSSNTFTAKTDTKGNFEFDDLPVKAGPSDTTYYEISISQPGMPPLNQIVKVHSSQIGKLIALSPLVIPSGRISLLVTDGQNPLPGVRIDFSQPGGKTTTINTSSNGLFESDNMLSKGTYRISVSRDNFLKPDDKSLRIDLPSDTSKVVKNILLPFMHEPVVTVYPDKPTAITVKFTKGAAGQEAAAAGGTRAKINGGLFSAQYTGIVKYKIKSSDQLSSVAMTQTDTGFTGNVPALYSLEDLIYSSEIHDNLNDITYSTDEITVKASPSGIINTLSMTPEINSSRLRLGESYSVSLKLKDAMQNNLNERFTGASHKGSVKWQAEDSSSVQISYPDASDSLKAIIKPIKEGVLKMNITAKLSSIVLARSIQFNSSQIDIKEIAIQSPVPNNSLSNKSGMQLSSSCLDSSSRSALLGNSLEWSVNPPGAGTVSPEGYFVPADSTVIGEVEVTATDQISGKSGKIALSVYASLRPGIFYSLTDKNGWSLMLPEGSIPFYSIVSFNKPRMGPAKKYYSPADGSQTFTVSDKLYNFRVESETGLPGDSLQKGATISLPGETSDKFAGGEKYIGWYNPVIKSWKVFNSSTGSAPLTAFSIYHWGEYSVLSSNENLGLQYVSVLPSPFSPDVSPMKIGYYLTTAHPPAVVTIKIYNLRGELVRTVLDNDFQYPGRYGSRTGNKEISWDGKTDDGMWARNGRYIIRISAKDNTGEKSEIIQCVLIK